jgi:hypothetical protein
MLNRPKLQANCIARLTKTYSADLPQGSQVKVTRLDDCNPPCARVVLAGLEDVLEAVWVKSTMLESLGSTARDGIDIRAVCAGMQASNLCLPAEYKVYSSNCAPGVAAAHLDHIEFHTMPAVVRSVRSGKQYFEDALKDRADYLIALTPTEVAAAAMAKQSGKGYDVMLLGALPGLPHAALLRDSLIKLALVASYLDGRTARLFLWEYDDAVDAAKRQGFTLSDRIAPHYRNRDAMLILEKRASESEAKKLIKEMGGM